MRQKAISSRVNIPSPSCIASHNISIGRSDNMDSPTVQHTKVEDEEQPTALGLSGPAYAAYAAAKEKEEHEKMAKQYPAWAREAERRKSYE